MWLCLSGGILPVQESDTAMDSFDKYVNEFKCGFDTEIEMSFSCMPS